MFGNIKQSPRYHTLCVFDEVALAWFDEFGSYSKGEVMRECKTVRDDGRIAKVITHGDSAKEMIAARGALAIPARFAKK